MMPSEKPTILVVDDDIDFREIVALVLDEKAEVLQADTVERAKVILDTRADIVLVITDWEIPDRHTRGDQVILKAREKGHRKVVVFTGCADQEQLQEIAALKPDAQLEKPVDISVLEETVDRLIS